MIIYSMKNTAKIIISITFVFLFDSHSVSARFHINESQSSQEKGSILTDFNPLRVKKPKQVDIHDSDLNSVTNIYITSEKGDSGILVSDINNKNHPEIILSGNGFVINTTQIATKIDQHQNKQTSKEKALLSQTKNTQLNGNASVSERNKDNDLDLSITPLRYTPSLINSDLDTTETIKLYINNGIFSFSGILFSTETNWMSIDKYTNPTLYTAIFDRYYAIVRNKAEIIHKNYNDHPQLGLIKSL